MGNLVTLPNTFPNPMKLPAFLLLAAAAVSFAADPALTIYNGGYAVVRETLPIDLKSGVNQVSFAGATAQVEADSVILRDIAGKAEFQILEQSYRNDPVSQAMLMSLFEGKTLEFNRRETNKPDRIVTGKVVRSGFVPGGNFVEPIIEVDGKLQFSLPGEPVFPSLGTDNVLKPTLNWKLNSSSSGKIDAEVAYLSRGFTWEASYNLVAEEKGDSLDIVGWVTMNNHSGMMFADAKIKLMAGDVNRVQPEYPMVARAMVMDNLAGGSAKVVTEKSFDEFHLYTLGNPVTLRDKETKQVEFVRATGVKAERIYVFEGSQQYNRRGSSAGGKVQVFREFKNSEANRLGLALPKGKVRFYSQDGDRQLEFVGENQIDHTPKNETIRVLVGNSFDLVGERRLVSQTENNSEHVATQTIEVKVRNRKKEPAEIRVVEHATRGGNWTLTAQSQPHEKKDATTFEFRVPLQPDEEKVVTYTIRYTW
ncbi:MAG: hypothetical protein RLZZ178_255 [Verrucomicrobiota bacterium]